MILTDTKMPKDGQLFPTHVEINRGYALSPYPEV